MGRIAVNVTDAQVEMIRGMAAAGRTTRQIASKVGLPVGVVNWQMEKHNIRTNHSRKGGTKIKWQPESTQDYSILPDDVIFDYRKFKSI